MDKYLNKTIAVVGYQLEGKALVDFLIDLEPERITIIDEAELSLASNHRLPNVELIKSKLEDIDFNAYDYVFRSPGIKIERLNVGMEKVSTLTNLFFERNQGKTVVVTGTKGKSTTALLLASILRGNGKKVFTGGNIGEPPLEFLKDIKKDDYVVLELSSFQLQDFLYNPDYVVILPLFPDHLDYHETEEEYYQSKANAIKNLENTIAAVYFDDLEKLKLSKNDNLLVYGEEKVGCNINSGDIVCRGRVVVEGADDFCINVQIPEIDLLAAATLADVLELKIDVEYLKKNFSKLPLRVEFIGEKCGAKFFNDSASTNPVSTSAAIDLMEGDTAIILGGSSKGLEIEGLARKIAGSEKVKKVYLFGSTKTELQDKITSAGYDGQLESCETLSEVFKKIESHEVKNVLFSPAFASFDQYANYKERGKEFTRLFEELKCENL